LTATRDWLLRQKEHAVLETGVDEKAVTEAVKKVFAKARAQTEALYKGNY
jgi:hypothetical protein